MSLTGSQILGRALKKLGADTFFYLMGGPMLAAERAALDEGLRGIDVRHEQAAAMMANAYARLTRRPGICMAASGPGTTNLITGVAHAFVDCAPLVVLGGSSPWRRAGTGVFQEIDQVAMLAPCSKLAERVPDPRRLPERLAMAWSLALAGKPGPVYLDLPGDMLYEAVPEAEIDWSPVERPVAAPRPAADDAAIAEAVELLRAAERPLVLSGSGIIWSDAAAALQAFVEAAGLPFWTTPQGRGVIPEDHPLCFPAMRATAFREADLVLLAGTRPNYVVGHLAPPRFAADAKVVRIEVDPGEIAADRRATLAIAADAGKALEQLAAALDAGDGARWEPWRKRLAEGETERAGRLSNSLASDETPIHPLRLCAELRDVLPREAVLVVDGQEILNFARQSIPSFLPGRRLNSGPFGTMGVGLPFALGAKAAKPEAPVVCLHGDGSLGMNAMELDTAVRHKLPVLVVVSLNGGWTGDPEHSKPGRDLGYTRFDRIAEALGCHGAWVEQPSAIRPALEAAMAEVAAGRPALVNVVTDWRVRADTASFTNYMT